MDMLTQIAPFALVGAIFVLILIRRARKGGTGRKGPLPPAPHHNDNVGGSSDGGMER